jgi:hypothetical protein
MLYLTIYCSAGVPYGFQMNGNEGSGSHKDYSSLNYQTNTGAYSNFGEMVIIVLDLGLYRLKNTYIAGEHGQHNAAMGMRSSLFPPSSMPLYGIPNGKCSNLNVVMYYYYF